MTHRELAQIRARLQGAHIKVTMGSILLPESQEKRLVKHAEKWRKTVHTAGRGAFWGGVAAGVGSLVLANAVLKKGR